MSRPNGWLSLFLPIHHFGPLFSPLFYWGVFSLCSFPPFIFFLLYGSSRLCLSDLLRTSYVNPDDEPPQPVDLVSRI
ncbi:hypothetical protein LZ32DRAFT_599700 [Colletotrichum eremochloae]|nr:hypothetical protein LZ32DRAFT_599700 [Colletotrichum eremochloae]